MDVSSEPARESASLVGALLQYIYVPPRQDITPAGGRDLLQSITASHLSHTEGPMGSGQLQRLLGRARSMRCCSRSTRKDVPATKGGVGTGAGVGGPPGSVAGPVALPVFTVRRCTSLSCARRRPRASPSRRRRRSAASSLWSVSGRPCGPTNSLGHNNGIGGYVFMHSRRRSSLLFRLGAVASRPA